LVTVATAHGFSEHTPSPRASRQCTSNFALWYRTKKGYAIDNKTVTFDGVIPNLLGRYMENRLRIYQKRNQEYMREKLCPVCLGKRLKPESLAVKNWKLLYWRFGRKKYEDALIFFEGGTKNLGVHFLKLSKKNNLLLQNRSSVKL
jgi:excinuclease UvrABC ATPase subunit